MEPRDTVDRYEIARMSILRARTDAVYLDLMDYLQTAIKYAHKNENFSTDGLLDIVNSLGSSNSNANASQNSDNCNEDLYSKFDFCSSCKYLTLGRNGTNYSGADCYYKTFKIDDVKKYSEALYISRKFRNNIQHAMLHEFHKAIVKTDVIMHPLTLAEIEWGREPISNYWRRAKDKLIQISYAIEVKADEVLCKIYGVTNVNEVTEAQKSNFNHVIDTFGIEVIDGYIFGISDQEAFIELVDSLKAVINSRNKNNDKRNSINEYSDDKKRVEIRNSAPKQPKTPKVFIPTQHQLDLLAKCKSHIPCEMNNSSAMLDCILATFALTMDESFIIDKNGRNFMNYIVPELEKQEKQVNVDESVICQLFKMLRESKLAIKARLETNQIDWNEIHQNCKIAIKMIYHMLQRRVLRILRSPTTSDLSHTNIHYIAENNTALKLLVLTAESPFAEKLGCIAGSCAVAVGPTIIPGRLFIYRNTRDNYSRAVQMIMDRYGGKYEKKVEIKETREVVVPTAVADAVNEHNETASCVSCEPPIGLDVLENNYVTLADCPLGKEISHGGEGIIYSTNFANIVAKVYFENKRTEERKVKLEKMVEANPNIAGLCWPTKLLFDEKNKWIGFLMQRANGHELAHTVFHPGDNAINIANRNWTRKSLVNIAANIAAVFAEMHKLDILMGDINPRNFMVEDNCKVYFVDCDSYQFGEYRCPVGTDLFTPPEVHKEMERKGEVNYGYFRTIENEKYSLSVLLFEVLMLGKAPFESKNNDHNDIVDAIKAGDFPYPYRNDDNEDVDGRVKTKLLAPSGYWRNIWSHISYEAKTAFFNAFTGKTRVRAIDWVNILRTYATMIERGYSSNELMPKDYKQINKEGGTRFVDLVCEKCGSNFNLGENVYHKYKRENQGTLCNMCRGVEDNFRKRPKTVICDHCKEKFTTTVHKWLTFSEKNEPLYCKNCFDIFFVKRQCTHCDTSFLTKREKVRNDLVPLCGACIDRNRKKAFY